MWPWMRSRAAMEGEVNLVIRTMISGLSAPWK